MNFFNKVCVKCYNENFELVNSFDEEVIDENIDCFGVNVLGYDFSKIKLRGKCNNLTFLDVSNYRKVNLSGFMDLEIGEIHVGLFERGILKILELNCKKVKCQDDYIHTILNKYVQEEPDPLMRDIQGCKYELAIKGYGDDL